MREESGISNAEIARTSFAQLLTGTPSPKKKKKKDKRWFPYPIFDSRSYLKKL